MSFPIQEALQLKQKPADSSKLAFGTVFTDYMFLMNYDVEQGWHSPRIEPYAPISLEPAAMCLHYGQEVFEGMKAYRAPDGRVLLFRPEKNFERMNLSNRRMCIPDIDEALALQALKELVRLEQAWIPDGEGTSLYIRPFIIATDPHVGVRSASHLLFMIILCPVGPYYPEGLNPVKIYVEQQYVRAVKGGTGFAKTAANYAVSLKAQEVAHELGYNQVLWLDGRENKYVEEVGAMNVFFQLGDEIVTPSLEGSTLSGITRMSCLELLRDWGFRVSERRLALQELEAAAASGTLREAFGTGTAAVISPIGELRIGEQTVIINNGEIGPVAQRLYDTLTAIQNGRTEDSYGWMTEV